MENDGVMTKGPKLQNDNVDITDATFKADDGSKFTLDIYIPNLETWNPALWKLDQLRIT